MVAYDVIYPFFVNQNSAKLDPSLVWRTDANDFWDEHIYSIVFIYFLFKFLFQQFLREIKISLSFVTL